MNPLHFLNEWTKQDESLHRISLDELSPFNINASTREFLSIAGLPENPAPFLSFLSNPSSVEAVSIGKVDSIYNLAKTYEKYLVIGSDSVGSPIVINTDADCVIQRLDHEMDFIEEFMNSSVIQLAHFLLLYRNFVTSVQELNGEDAFLNCDFSDEQYEDLGRSFKEVDARAAIEGFWRIEMERLLFDREYYRNNP